MGSIVFGLALSLIFGVIICMSTLSSMEGRTRGTNALTKTMHSAKERSKTKFLYAWGGSVGIICFIIGCFSKLSILGGIICAIPCLAATVFTLIVQIKENKDAERIKAARVTTKGTMKVGAKAATGVGTAAGAAIGSVAGGPAGTAIGAKIGKDIGDGIGSMVDTVDSGFEAEGFKDFDKDKLDNFGKKMDELGDKAATSIAGAPIPGIGETKEEKIELESDEQLSPALVKKCEQLGIETKGKSESELASYVVSLLPQATLAQLPDGLTDTQKVAQLVALEGHEDQARLPQNDTKPSDDSTDGDKVIDGEFREI